MTGLDWFLVASAAAFAIWCYSAAIFLAGKEGGYTKGHKDGYEIGKIDGRHLGHRVSYSEGYENGVRAAVYEVTQNAKEIEETIGDKAPF